MTNSIPSVLIVSEDTELVETLINNNNTGQEFFARDSVQFILDDPTLIDNNSIVLFDVGDNESDRESKVDQVLKIKQHDPTQVVMLIGEAEILGDILKSNIQPLIFRAFTKPISANQVFLAFKSGNALHQDLVAKQVAGVDISIVGPAENKTSVASLVGESNNNSVVYGAIALAAIGIVGWLIFSSNNDQTTPTTPDSETVSAVESETIAETDFIVTASVQKINELNQEASLALLEERVIAPKGDNALYYYDQVLAIDAYDTTAYTGKKEIADRLRASYNKLIGTAEFDRALKVIKVLQRIEPLNLQNDALLGGLEKAIEVHVKKIKSVGTPEEIARTTAVLKILDSQFEGSKSASQALQTEKALVLKIDDALDNNNLIPPKKGNAYSLVSKALKDNSVSNANIVPRVKGLSAKLLRMANENIEQEKLEDAITLAALAKRLNVDPKGLAALNKRIKEIQTENAKVAEQEKKVVAEAAPEPPKIIPAKIISRVPPRYPNRAINRDLEGWVQVRFSIDQQGNPIKIKIVSSEPKVMFDAAALKAVAKWRFSPARNEETGLPVESKPITTKVNFKLE